MGAERMHARRLLVAALAALSLSACAGLSPRTVEVLQEGPYCREGNDRQVRALSNQAALDAAWRATSTRLDAGEAPRLDFGRQAGLLVADAERPTAGYALHPAERPLTVRGALATLNLTTSVPEGPVAQVVTRPCLLLAVPLGDYRRIEVIDQSGTVWGAVRVPAVAPEGVLP